MDSSGMVTSVGASARRDPVHTDRSSTKLFVAVRDCVHVTTRDAAVGSPLTITLVDASAAAPVETMRFLIQDTVHAKRRRLPNHQPEATPLLKQPSLPLVQRHGLPMLAASVHVCAQYSTAIVL